MSNRVDPQEVLERALLIRGRLAMLAADREVNVVAVTKGFGVDAPRAALGAGLKRLGENYAQELIAKYRELTDGERDQIEWHFLGRLQRNKVRSLAPIVSVWQSVDRVELINEIAHRAPGAKVMIQLNLSQEPQKGGAPLSEADALVALARERELSVIGLMGVGTAEQASGTDAAFRQLVALADRLGLDERSIGMSDDLDVAVAAGSTMVRIGTGLFGNRPLRGPS
ncbi:MAG: YggS family pyridoxal phosphate-dependent enzyme [Acidimicrobiales bacterium]